jgi:hypothetical protein
MPIVRTIPGSPSPALYRGAALGRVPLTPPKAVRSGAPKAPSGRGLSALVALFRPQPAVSVSVVRAPAPVFFAPPPVPQPAASVSAPVAPPVAAPVNEAPSAPAVSRVATLLGG